MVFRIKNKLIFFFLATGDRLLGRHVPRKVTYPESLINSDQTSDLTSTLISLAFESFSEMASYFIKVFTFSHLAL
jgi:hypothetical protein